MVARLSFVHVVDGKPDTSGPYFKCIDEAYMSWYAVYSGEWYLDGNTDSEEHAIYSVDTLFNYGDNIAKKGTVLTFTQS